MSKLSEPRVYKSRGYTPYAEWPEEKKEAARARARKHREKNVLRARGYARKWQLNNPDRVREMKMEWMAKPENRIKNSLYAAKRRAKAVGIEFSVSIADLLPLPEFCPVLGIALNYQGIQKSGGMVNDSPTVDRIDSTRGYVQGNVRIISWRANRIKSDATIGEIRQILAYMERELS